ncbi:hypothetical protein Ae168Ps1_5849c [Pseudonocardia sp. Ae168_Ps1]|uniref:DUF418 domain-containing protein n=1 Tax=unclassified Pseudonocardia TaxID=2619320 RepID=UPI00094B05D1|nr:MULTISPECIES: DUF418 domain-containing protein [unclassified Pseudonocardia]OLL71346.1 hypothetical protein Ae168Ps1_5849c [Pseudonocardia sp. Ae168_Ps1]OLL77103.1 hypothetical protein Ae150APs1_5481 [Pseudonocardia sp. Ae150A_Ps1]OLL88789.1 hypothetical protein Ae263Ps1_5844c [Pseudonocardia sp. Ae263_Ps1]OLL91191.1 hypothetical protein Ae356Ps1_1088 [Pseudonocardia sp. Ae356_Ps1]
MTVENARPPLAGPLGMSGRAPAPDLARGAMLLLIALANTPFYLYGREHSQAGFHPVEGSVVDKIVQAVLITGVDMRVYPMFAFLFGYGLAVIYRRQRAKGVPERDAYRLLQRRNLWLLVFGFVHAALLWGGDVLGAYGLCGLLLVWLFVRRADRTLLVWAGVGTGVLVLLAGFAVFGAWAVLTVGASAGGGMPADMTASASQPSVLAAVGDRLALWPLITLGQGVVGLTVPIAIGLGFWTARRRILEQPEQHLRLLRVTAVVGIALGWAGGLPHALAHVGVIGGWDEIMWVFAATQLVTGLACGVGYVALFGLIGSRLAGRPLGPVGSAVTAVGKRSLSCYLAQSVLCAPVLAAWGLGWGASLGSTTMALYAVGVWLVTLVFAVVLERRGPPGPAETLLRRLSYRSTSGASAPA